MFNSKKLQNSLRLNKGLKRLIIFLLIFNLYSCIEEEFVGIYQDQFPLKDYPRLVMTDDDLKFTQSRLQVPPVDVLYERLKSDADKEPVAPTEGVYNYSTEHHNASCAEAAAFFAYVEKDASYAEKAISIMMNQMTENLGTQLGADDNIRISPVLIYWTQAMDLIFGTDFITAEEQRILSDKLYNLASDFFEFFVEGSPILLINDNNHVIKTVGAPGMTALLLPDYPDSQKWLEVALANWDYFLNDSSRGYFADGMGGCAEGAHYYLFGMVPGTQFVRAYQRMYGPYPKTIRNECVIPRSSCISGEVVIQDLLNHERLRKSYEWLSRIRLPNGLTPPFDDGRLWVNRLGGLAATYYNIEEAHWDWLQEPTELYSRYPTSRLLVNYVAEYNPYISASIESWNPTQFCVNAGNLVFRNSWDRDAIYLMVLAENGTMRDTTHEHVDALSFMMYAYDDFLILDPGYHDWPENQISSIGQRHNQILVDGKASGTKSYMDQSDVDSFTLKTLNTDGMDYVKVFSTYQEVDIYRHFLFAKEEYFIIYDRMEGKQSHDYTFLLQGFGGGTRGDSLFPVGIFDLNESISQVEISRERAKLHMRITSSQGIPSFETEINENMITENKIPRDHTTLLATINGEDESFLTLLYPEKIAHSFPATTIVPPSGNGISAIVIENGGERNVAIVREYGADQSFSIPGFQSVETDAEFLWLAVEATSHNLLQSFMEEGTYLKYNNTLVDEVIQAEGEMYE